ncbi:MAG: ABC transporter ATP-binding protein, partial [Thermomicrobiales bacterium]|nr:ABC transporter ATP-binding protein [Thermomicrobiales bacterium]
GPSGCGKSTTLRMIAGLEEPTSGDIRIGGRSVVGLPAHTRNVAVAFENYALFPPLTVEENITFGMRARGELNARQRARDVAERLGIEHLLDRKPGGLSSGQKQRVSLARAIVRTPSVLLLDEPLSHLDAAERDATRRELKRLQRETGFTTVLVTHDQHEALSLADRIAVMNDGTFQHVGTADDVYDRPANLFVADFVGEPRMNLLPGRLRTEADGSLVAALGPNAAVALGRTTGAGLDGQEITLGIRPQDIRVEARGTARTLPATVFAFEPLQELGRLTLNLAGTDQRLVVETHHDMVAVPGETVGLQFDLARTHLFDTATGERLPWESAPAPMTR